MCNDPGRARPGHPRLPSADNDAARAYPGPSLRASRSARILQPTRSRWRFVALGSALVLGLGCGEETTEPLLGDLGLLEGQVTFFDDEAPPKVRLERRLDSSEDGAGGWRWTVSLDADGRFAVPVPAGRYRAQIAPRATDTSLELYLTAAGIQPECIGCEIVVEPGIPSPFLQGSLGRATIEVQVPEGHPGQWWLELHHPDSGLDRAYSASPESGLLRFEPTRLPEFAFDAVIRSPYGEEILPRLARADSLTTGVHPDAQGLVPHTAILPDPTWIAVRTSPPLPEEFVAAVGRPTAFVAGPLWGLASEELRHDGAGTWSSPTIPLFGSMPFRIHLANGGFAVWAGGPTKQQATIFEPTPGRVLEVVVEVAGLTCSLRPPEGRVLDFGRLYLHAAGSNEDVASFGLGQPAAEAASFVLSPGSFLLRYRPADRAWSLPPQTRSDPVSMEAGAAVLTEWTLSPGATLHGRLGRRWRKDERFWVTALAVDDEHNWELQPDLDPDSLGFRLGGMPDGEILLEHVREGPNLYYPGTTSNGAAEWIHIENGEDVHGVIFLR